MTDLIQKHDKVVDDSGVMWLVVNIVAGACCLQELPYDTRSYTPVVPLDSLTKVSEWQAAEKMVSFWEERVADKQVRLDKARIALLKSYRDIYAATSDDNL
jgi:hypothetical protein